MPGTVWWKRGVVYQIYPRSFQDSNGDGVGDLAGITSRLGYLQDLGIDAIWISPIFPSPMKDFGYDVSDYCGVHPLFGSLADFDALIAEAHRRGLKVILDFVPNHTSDQHPWFVESRSSRDNPKRDWYVWRDAKPDGSAPNNWVSNFGGSAWLWDDATGQYFYHAFLKEQPDLNWRNPDLREAMHDVLRFWLDRGVDGFRIDVAHGMSKPEGLPDSVAAVRTGLLTGGRDGDPRFDHEGVHDVHRMIRAVVDHYPGRVTVGQPGAGAQAKHQGDPTHEHPAWEPRESFGAVPDRPAHPRTAQSLRDLGESDGVHREPVQHHAGGGAPVRIADEACPRGEVQRTVASGP